MSASQTLTPYVQLAEAGCLASAALDAETVADRAAVLVEAFTANRGALIPLTDQRTAERLVRAAQPGTDADTVAVHARFLSGVSNALWAYETELQLAAGSFTLEPSPDGLLYVDENGLELLEEAR